MSEKEERPMTDPRADILAIRQQIAQMGANEDELSMIDGILKRLDAREISDEEAKREAQKILDNKQDYH